MGSRSWSRERRQRRSRSRFGSRESRRRRRRDRDGSSEEDSRRWKKRREKSPKALFTILGSLPKHGFILGGNGAAAAVRDKRRGARNDQPPSPRCRP